MQPQIQPRKHIPIAGQRFGKLVLVQRVHDDTLTKSANLIVRVRVECDCGRRLTVPYYYLTRKSPLPKSDCGKCDLSLKQQFKQEYGIWQMMHVRCEDPRHIAYKSYGGRGINVCDEWHRPDPSIPQSLDNKGFNRFLEYIGARPSMKFSIDRVDNDLGYQPFQSDGVTRQLRWATAKEQRANQRPRN